VQELKPEGNGEGEKHLSLADAKKAASDAAERQILERGLQEQGGKVSELARQLDMNRSHLQTLLKKHGLSSKNYRVKS
jgi:DNA-binding NtrC family response regulator